MNNVRLTDRFIKAAKTGPHVIEYPDSIQTGLSLRVWPSGKKSWAVRYWKDGKSVRSTIGQWPEVGLGEARDLAGEARRAKRRGEDPRGVLKPPPGLASTPR